MMIPSHIERQRQYGPTFWCGTAFCGHETIDEAADCWERRCVAVAKMQAEFKRLEQSGEGYPTVLFNQIVWVPYEKVC